VFRKATPEALDLIAAMLEYTPTQRVAAIEAMIHPFFDEIRDPSCRFPDSRHPGGATKDLPPLFDFSRHGLTADVPLLMPRKLTRTQNSPSLPNTTPASFRPTLARPWPPADWIWTASCLSKRRR
jgi:serine/threonine protein kinase